MPLKLNSFSGGSVTLNPASTASDFTHTLPAVSGTVVTTGSSAVVTPAMLSTGAPGWNAGGDLSFNSGFGSAGVAYGCRAWVNFNGTGVVAIRASGNVSSITDNGTGHYTVNFTNAMPDVNYCAVFGGENIAGIGNSILNGSGTRATGSLTLLLTDFANNSRDDDTVQVAIFR